MNDKKRKHRRAFIPSDPQDHHRTQIEMENWKAELEIEKERDRRETRRFIITTVISSIAAVGAIAAAVAGIIACLR